YLLLDNKGMSWWFNDKEDDMVDKHKTQALSFPLFKGKTWNTYIDDIKANVECLHTDTLITTKIGELKTVHIITTYAIKKQSTKDHTVYSEIQEFYHEKFGKVASKLVIYAVENGKSKRHLINSSEVYLVKVDDLK
ncbi:hypothetical protein ACFLRI_05105, partial [Bacteroidota bacterium]